MKTIDFKTIITLIVLVGSIVSSHWLSIDSAKAYTDKRSDETEKKVEKAADKTEEKLEKILKEVVESGKQVTVIQTDIKYLSEKVKSL